MRIVIVLFLLIVIDLSAKKEFVNVFPKIKVYTLQCLDSNNCYAFAKYNASVSRIFRTTDQGATWFLIHEHDHLAADDPFWNLISGFVYDTNNIYINYGYEDNYKVMAMDRSTDGGKTFERIFFDGMEYRPGLGVSWMGMYNENIGAVVMTDGIIYTKDNWETLNYYLYEDIRLFGRTGFFLDSTSFVVPRTLQSNHLMKFDMEKEEITQYSDTIPPRRGGDRTVMGCVYGK